MKKVLIGISVILIVALAGIGIFVATFDIAPYKGFIISRLERMTGNKVEIGRLSLKWKNGILLGVEDFKMYTKPVGNRTASLTFDSANALVEPAALLMRRVPISSLDIYNGTIRFQDMATEPASDITIRKIEAKINNISDAGAMRFTVKMAPVSADQNMLLSGTAGGFVSGSPFIRDCDIKADLAAIDHNELEKAFPVLQKLGLAPGLAGELAVKIRELEFSKGKISKLSADISLSRGKIVIVSLKAPVDNINLSVSAEGNSATVNSFSAELAEGSLTLSGKSDDIFVLPKTTFRAAVEVRGVKSFISKVLARKQNMDGNMRLTFDGSMSGLSWPDISKTLSGGGEFYLDRGVVMNTNILNQTLGSLTLFPGLSDMARGYVPEPIQQAFANNDTVIEPLRQSYTIEEGYVMMPNLDLRTDTFDLRGEAKSSLTGDISGSGVIRFAQDVSAAMLKAAPEMKYITDSQGIVEFPLSFKIGENGFKAIPDMKYIGTKVAVQKAGDAVAGFIQKASESSADPGSAGISSGKFPKLKDLIKGLKDQ
ncbi:MAG: hypothetical protein NTY76_06505 [Candidatus Omnitrophica bacterium]|nr:hypothetical protein [Candidatus Omnitrophota bacterium]